MTHPLALVLTHVRAKGRPSQYDAILLAEVDRLRAENAELKADLDAAAAWIRDTFPDRKESADV